MHTSAQDIYESILHRAADEWNVDYDDVERDIGQRFDPIVRFMAGGLASELEKVHQLLDETEGRLQERLAKVLLPEYYHLPQPAHALASAQPNGDVLLIDETTGFSATPEEGKQIHFSPLLPSRLLPAKVVLVATENALVSSGQRAGRRNRTDKETKEETRRLLIGFSAPEFPENWQGVSLFFDLTGSSRESGETTRFLATLHNCSCSTGTEQLIPLHGLPRPHERLEDHLNGNEHLWQQVAAYYQQHFLTFQSQDVQASASAPITERLTNWFARSTQADIDIEQQLSHLKIQADQSLFWIEIQLGQAMEIERLSSRLNVQFNVFPVVNRQLNGHQNGEHYFMRKTAIKWLHLQPKDPFLSIRRVYQEKPPENPVFTYKPFADFKEDKSPSYTIRHGGVGRWDEFNTWKRLAYVVSILQENYAHQELIQKAANSLSLEEVHHLLGKKIAAGKRVETPTQDIYILLHSGLFSGVRVRVEYWTSRGLEANGVLPKTALKCTSKVAASLEKDQSFLLTQSTGGRDPLNRTEQLNALKSSILSRGRIVTREDVKTYCLDFLREKVDEVHVRDGVGHDPRFNFGMSRMLDVIIIPTAASRKDDWEAICYQLQHLLEHRSSSNIPIRVLKEDTLITARP